MSEHKTGNSGFDEEAYWGRRKDGVRGQDDGNVIVKTGPQSSRGKHSIQAQFGDEQSGKPGMKSMRRSLQDVRGLILLSLILAVAAATDVMFNLLRDGVLVFDKLQELLILLFGAGLAIPMFLSPRLSQRRLEIIGFTFSAIGILTGLLPGILDVAGIKVTSVS